MGASQHIYQSQGIDGDFIVAPDDMCVGPRDNERMFVDASSDILW